MHTLSAIAETYFRLCARVRCEATRRQYRFAIGDFEKAIGRTATLDDLTEDNLAAMVSLLQARSLSIKTINERVGRITAMWNWLHRRGTIHTAPTAVRIPEPRRVPIAWTREQLDALFAACAQVKGSIGGVPASKWWTSLHYVAWDTGERISALMACEWRHLEGEWLTIPAELRKGQRADRIYRLAADTLAQLATIREPSRDKIWPWPLHRTYLWTRYRTIRRRAGLPDDRKSSFHRMRKSVGTHAKAAGGNASDLLGHLDPRTTAAYLDPRVVKPPMPVDYLFRPRRFGK